MLTSHNRQSRDHEVASTLLMMSDFHPAPKRRKYNTDYVNVIYKAGYTNMQNEHVYNLQRNQALQTHAPRPTLSSPAFSLYSSTESYRSTPSPDFALSMSQTSSPLFLGFPHAFPSNRVATTTPPLQYFQPVGELKASAEHNYAVSSVSSVTTETRSTSQSPDLVRPPVGCASSDSGNSTMPDEINPLCMNDWFRDLLKSDLAGKLQEELALIAQRSALQKEQFLTMKMNELPSDLEYNPNKSRLRKVYENPSEAAERERNNLASRRSRFKKKIAQQITNFHLEFDRTENTQLYAIQNWIGKIIFELESKWLDSGASSEDLCKLRRSCGFPQGQSEKGYSPEAYS